MTPNVNCHSHRSTPGGRLEVSDMVTTEDLAGDEREMLRTWANCIEGAIRWKNTLVSWKLQDSMRSWWNAPTGMQTGSNKGCRQHGRLQGRIGHGQPQGFISRTGQDIRDQAVVADRKPQARPRIPRSPKLFIDNEHGARENPSSSERC